MASPTTWMANGGPPSTIASWISKYHCHDGLWPSWIKKFQKSKARRSCPHWTSPPGSGQSLSTPMTNISWHSPSATDSIPSHGAPSANSLAEFNIFLNKACPDARVRGNLVCVDDVLMKSSSVEDHLKEIDHALNQLTTAGAKIALHKGQWCKTKVNYVGLLVGRNGIKPQSNRAQAIQSIRTPTNVSELRSFLGVCNYSQ